MPLSQSLYWRPPADQKASGLWVRDCLGIEVCLECVAAERALEFFKCFRVFPASIQIFLYSEAFEELKSMLSSDTVQAYFDP